jgi:hypothetical protein
MASTQRATLYSATGLSAASTDGEKQSLPTRARNHIGYLVVANPNGATTVAAKIQHSPDGVDAWTDLITFTTTTAGASAKEVIVPTGDRILPYVRAQIVLGGATKLADVSVYLFVENYAG